MRLGVYADLVYRRSGRTVSTDLAFIRVVTGLAPLLGEVVVFGRLDPRSQDPGPHELSGSHVRFVALPHYDRVTSVRGVLGSARAARRIFAAELPHLDAVWLFGPHVLSLVFAQAARRKTVPVALGIRQDFPSYIAHRLPGRGWLWAIPVAHAFEHTFRLLSRRFPTVVVGEQLGQRYGGGSAPTLVTGFSLVHKRDIVPLDEALARPWDGPLRLLSVGRLDPEKNPLLLAAIMHRLRRLHADWHLTVAGAGPFADELQRRIAELGLADAVTLAGEVPFGPALNALYRSSHAFLHVSLTEGVPQVLFEAQAAGLPIVATDVGGVAAALRGGEAGLLIPPGDVATPVAALERLRGDEALRRRLVAAGLALIAGETAEAQGARLDAFFRSMRGA